MKLLDTNIIIYAAGRPHPYKESCARLLEAVEMGSSDYGIDTELLQEVLYVYTSRSELARGLETFDALLRMFPWPIPIRREEIVAARRILEAWPAISPRDASHAAVVQTNGLEGIVTTDQAFRGIAGVTAFDPRDLAPGL